MTLAFGHLWSALANVALNALGLALFGLIGAALATARCMILWNAWMHRLVSKKLNLSPSIIAALRADEESPHGPA